MKLLLALFILLNPRQELRAYTLEQMQLSDYGFHKYVIPNLKIMANDWRTLFFMLNDHLSDFEETLPLVENIYLNFITAKKTCHNVNNDNCLKKLNDIKLELLKLQKKLLDIPLPPPTSTLINFHEPNYGHSLNENQDLVAKLILLIDQTFFYESISAQKQLSFPQLLKVAHNLFLQFNLTLLKNSRKEYRKTLHAYWLTGLYPIREFIFVNEDKKYFMQSLTETNIRWNELNVFLTKKNHNVSGATKSLLMQMQNRWISILKVTLKQDIKG